MPVARRRSRTNWSGSASVKGTAGQVKGAYQSFDQLVEAQEKRIPGKAQIVIQVPERLGGKVIEVEGISKAYGDKLLFEDLTFTLPPGGIVGVIGPNGAGKSTLFKLITGQETPDAGKVDNW
ncbi:Energy-dependent translational throttle protein EttA [Aphelenchoides bicaudatus]|nr:Energy-dependent translational throttle protein EttA [Aphelenchoides bicaudatus]